MKTRTTILGSLVAMLAVAGLAGCGGSGSGVVAQSAKSGRAGFNAPPSAASPSPAAGYAESAPPAASSDMGSSSSRSEAPTAGERPGLGTEWGETRYSHVSHVSFERSDANHPADVVSLYYNDREGARAMARYADYREMGDAVVSAPRLGVSIALNDASGRPLPAFYASGHTYAIGEAGQRYTIAVRNRSGARVEAVASVDGLDVLDGESADFAKRGYLVPAWGEVEIDGFRQSSDHVAAFRFGSVRDSYAARTGSDRNVGVIGVAVFTQRGTQPWPWTRREIERRESADPFPGHFASPPPPRW